jgi:hypothetical protein
MAPFESLGCKRTCESELAGTPALPDGYVFPRPRTGLCIALLLLSLFPMAQGQDLNMKISHKRTLVLKSSVLVEPADGTSAVPLYTVVLQKDPFVEIHLQTPLSQAQVDPHRLRFFCEEVGVFTDGRSAQSWTIGKGCKPLYESHH